MSSTSKNNWTNWHHLFHKEILRNKNFIPEGIHILVSVSGGQDSMSLMILLNEIKNQHNWSISAWHGDHKWHSQSQIYAIELKKFCLQKNISLQVDSSELENVATEEKAREWRYRKLYENAEKIISEKSCKDLYIMTGHTSSDNAETFLLNIARGSNYKGLRGIPKKRLLKNKFYIVRPILMFSRENTASICQALKIPIWKDPSNTDLKIKRNFIRHNIILNLEKIYPGCSCRINTFIEKMKRFHAEREDLCSLAMKSCTNKNGLRRKILITLGEEARSTILLAFLKGNCLKQISTKNLDEMSKQIPLKHNGEVNLQDGIKVIWNKDSIYLKNLSS